MKKTKFILWAIALMMVAGCEDLGVLDDSGTTNYYSPFYYSNSMSDDAKHPLLVFPDWAVILDVYNSYNGNYYILNVDGLEVSTSQDFHGIDKTYTSDNHKVLSSSYTNRYYWKVDGLKPRTTYYYRYFSIDKLGGRGYSETFSFTTNNIELNDLVEVIELSPTLASIRLKWDDAVTSSNNIGAIFFSVIQGNDTLRLKGQKKAGAYVFWEADFPMLSPNTAYKLETKVMVNVKLWNLSYDSYSYSYSSSYPSTLTTSTTFTTPQYKATEFVDLGTGLKWATCNLGATKPWQTGGYYNYPSTYEDVAGTSLDIVKNALGAAYRMPTREELEQLCNICSWTEKVENGVKGMRCTGTNGNSIFFPYAGYIESSSNYYNEYYQQGYSDKSTLYINSGSGKHDIDRYEDPINYNIYKYYYHRLIGSNGKAAIEDDYSNYAIPIRPVTDK